jgi:thiosulfate/3-mercaptopyruvate sulfurtransferase
MKLMRIHLIVLMACLVAPLRLAHAAIVDTDFVVQALARGAIVWDVRGEEEYNKAHIPGAVNLDDPQNVLRDGKNEDLLPIPELERILGELGIDPSKEIVVYGSKGMPSAYFAEQTLRYLGADKVSVYHGGFDDWKAAGKPAGAQRTVLPPAAFEAKLRKDRMVSTQDVLARLDRPDVQLVDARTAKEFSGDDIRALRGGHIPGAINIPYEDNWVDPDTTRKLQRRQVRNKDGMALKSREQLKALYAALDPEKETIVYCQSGSRSSVTATVLEELGFQNVKLYDGSWLAYGNTFDLPAQNVSYFNVGRVNGTLNQMQSRIDALEAELEALKSHDHLIPAGARKP